MKRILIDRMDTANDLPESTELVNGKYIVKLPVKIKSNMFFPLLPHNFGECSSNETKSLPEIESSRESVEVKTPSQSPEHENTNSLKKYISGGHINVTVPHRVSLSYIVSLNTKGIPESSFIKDGSFKDAKLITKSTRSEKVVQCESHFDTKVWVGTYPDNFITKWIAESVKKASEHKSNGNYTESLQLLNRALVVEKNNPLCVVNRAEVFFLLGDFQEAAASYRRAIFLFPECQTFSIRLAKLYFIRGQMNFDLKMYQKAFLSFMEAFKFDGRLIYLVKSCLLRMNLYNKAKNLLKSLIEKHPDNSDLIVMKARLQFMSGKYEKTFYELENLIDQTKNSSAIALLQKIKHNAENIWSQSIQFNMQQLFEPAIARINVAIRLWPNRAKYIFLRGVLYRHIRKYTLAIEDIMKAVKMSHPDEIKSFIADAERQLLLTFNDFSLECFKTGKIDKAIVLLNKAIAQEKTQIGLYLNRAECFYQTGDYNFALLDYKQAMELGDLDKKYYPRISELYYLLAKGYYSSGEFESCIVKIEQSLSLTPTCAFLYKLRAKCRYMLLDTRRAKEDILLSYFLDPNDKDIISVFKYLFPSTPGRGIFNSPLANEIKMKAKRLLSDPNIYQLAHQNKSLPDKNIVISTLCAEPLCVTGISTPPVHQVLNLAFKNRTPMLHLKGNNLCLEKQNTILPKTPSGGNFFELWNQSMNIPKRKTTDQKLIKEISREVSNFFD